MKRPQDETVSRARATERGVLSFFPWLFSVRLSPAADLITFYIYQAQDAILVSRLLSLISGGLHYSEGEHRGPSGAGRELLLTPWRGTGAEWEPRGGKGGHVALTVWPIEAACFGLHPHFIRCEAV